MSAATLTFTAGETAKTVSVATAEDTRNEDQEEFTVTLSGQTNATLGTSIATGTIDDDDGEPGLRIAGATVSEGEPVAFVVSLEPASGKPVTVSYETADGTAEAGEDYTAVSATTLTFTAGETAKTVSVATAEDTRNEDQEEFTVTLSAQTNATLGTSIATGTIDDDDGEPGLRIAGATVNEGEPVAFVVSLEPASGKPVTVSYETADGTAEAGEDYTAVSATTLTFTAGETAKTVSVATAEDTRNEDQEEFTVTLSEQTNATLGTSIATGTIDDDDGEPELRIAGAAVSEGEPVAFVVSLVPASGKPVTVSYETADGTAEAGEDYTAVSETTLTFTAGETAKTVSVATAEDTRNEDQESFTVTLSDQTNATLGTASATGTIADDDELTVSVAGPVANVEEGQTATFTVTVGPQTKESTTAVVVSYEVDTEASTATAADYTALSETELTIGAGVASGTIDVVTATDAVLEPDETLVLKLTGASTAGEVSVSETAAAGTATIEDTGAVKVSVKPLIVEDDDPDTTNVIETDDKSIVEEGQSAMFAVELSGAVASALEVSYETSDGTAVAGEDYTAVSATTLTFTAGDTAKTVTVATLADDVVEAAETFTVSLTAPNLPTDVSLGTSSATGTITDTDALHVSVAPEETTVDEGEIAKFIVTLSDSTRAADVVVTYEIDDTNSTATADDDYEAPSSTTLTIVSGSSSGTIEIQTKTDIALEEPETLIVTLQSASSIGGPVTFSTTPATITIANATTFGIGVKRDSEEPVGNSASVQVSSTLRRSATTVETRGAANVDLVENSDTCNFPCMIEGTAEGTQDSERLTFFLQTNTNPPEPVQIEEGHSVVVSYVTSDGSATADVDYKALSGTLTYTSTAMEHSLTLETKPDALHEGDETFTFTMHTASLPDMQETVGFRADIRIQDDDTLVAADSGLTVALSSPGSFPATGRFTVNITFSENVTGFELADILVANGTAGDFGGSDASYTVRITPQDEFHGHVTVTVPAGVAVDADDATRPNVAGSKSFSVNTTASPTVTIESWDDFPAHRAFDVTVRFSESVSRFTLDDIEVTHGVAGNFAGASAT